jgi:hypothetical protein
MITYQLPSSVPLRGEMMAGPGPEEALSTTAGAAEATAITPERMEAVLMMEALVES